MDKLGLKVEERDVYLSELNDFEEVGACGTAAAVTPIYEIVYKEKVIYQKDFDKVGIISQQLSKMITDIQIGNFTMNNQWIVKINF